MADFSTSNIGGGAASAVQPQQPVVDRSSTQALNAFGDIASSLAKVGAQFYNTSRQVESQKALNNAVSAFTQQQLKLADAVDQGVMSSQEARMRMRANYTSAISNNPGLTGILADTQKDILNTSGLGKVVAEGTEQEKIQLAVQKEASMAGWIKPGASPAEVSAGVASYTQFKYAQQMIDAQQNQLALDRGKIGLESDKIGYQRQQIGLQTDRIQQASAGVNLQSARMSLQEKVQTQQSRMALGQMADAYNYKFSQELDQIRTLKEQGKITPQEAIQRADAAYATITQVTGQVGRDAGGEYVNNITKPMEMRYQNTVKFLNGEIDSKVLDTQNQISTGLQKANLLGDPATARVVATSNLFGNSVAAAQAVNGEVARILSKNSDPNGKNADPMPDNAEDKAHMSTYLGLLKDNMSAVNTGKVNNADATKQELNTNLSNILKGIDVHSVSTENPTEYNQITDFIASPEFGKYSSQGGGINASAAQNAATILQSQYIDQVVPLLKQQYEQAMVGGMTGATAARSLSPSSNAKEGDPAAKIIKPDFSGGGVVFRSDRRDSATRNKVNDLNKRVAPVINKLIRMDAHLNGTTDYKAGYTKYYDLIFGAKQEGSQE